MQHALPGEPRENLRNQTYHTQTFVLADAQKTAQETIRKRKPVLSIPALAQALFSKATQARM